MIASFFGTKGAPGATSTVLLLAARWSRPCTVLDLDPDGGGATLLLRAGGVRTTDAAAGLLAWLTALRRDPGARVTSHALVTPGGLAVVPGFEASMQGRVLETQPDVIVEALRSEGVDVLVDAGTLRATSLSLGICLRASDVAVVVTRTTFFHLARLRAEGALLADGPDGGRAARDISPAVTPPVSEGRRLAVLPLAENGGDASGDVRVALPAPLRGRTTVLPCIPYDERAAQALLSDRVRRRPSAMFLRALDAAGGELLRVGSAPDAAARGPVILRG